MGMQKMCLAFRNRKQELNERFWQLEQTGQLWAGTGFWRPTSGPCVNLSVAGLWGGVRVSRKACYGRMLGEARHLGDGEK